MKILKITIIVLVIIISAFVYAYLNRASIFYHSLNMLINNLLPGYMKVERLDFDFENSMVTIRNFRILNPVGFKRTSLIRIPKINATYSLRDKENILGGVEVSNVVLYQPMLYLERSIDGKINIQRMVRESGRLKEVPFKLKLAGLLVYLFSPVEKTYDLGEIRSALKRIDGLIEMKPVLIVKEGTLTFNDRYLSPEGHKTTVEEIEAILKLKPLAGFFKGIDYIEAGAKGYINGKKEQDLRWDATYDPKAPKLTMSNTIKIRNADLIHFSPYYDKFSPFIFKKGRASGELIINFDNGSIGSMNELRFSELTLEIKEDYPHGDFWAVSAQELYKYFMSQTGEILFDFKIKGAMDSPKFYLGPKSKRALTVMVVDKITEALIGEAAKPEPQPVEVPAEVPTEAPAKFPIKIPTRAGSEEIDTEKIDIDKIIEMYKKYKRSR